MPMRKKCRPIQITYKSAYTMYIFIWAYCIIYTVISI